MVVTSKVQTIAITSRHLVKVVNVTGTPHARLRDWGVVMRWLITAVERGNTLTFNYTIGAGETSGDLDYVAINSLTLPAPSPTKVDNLATTGTAPSVKIVGNYAYIADGNSGLAIIDITDPTNLVGPGGGGTPVYEPTNGTAYGIDVVGSYAYVADGPAGLAIINISDPTDPGTPVYRDTNGNAREVKINGSHAYIADGNVTGLAIIDISDPANPGAPSYTATGGWANEIDINGSHAYVGNGTPDGLAIIDISNPASPGTPVKQNTNGFGYGVSVVGNYAYIADGNSGLAIIDISNPASPSIAGLRNITGGSAKDVDVKGNYAYFAATGKFVIIDISDPSNPGTPVEESTTNANGIEVKGNYAYLGSELNGLEVWSLNGGGTIQDAAGNDATVNFGDSRSGIYSLGANRKALIVDTSVPTISSVSLNAANSELTVTFCRRCV